MPKSLHDVKEDMSALYDQLKAGTVDMKVASEMSNVAGKFLKAEQLILAREVFESSLSTGAGRIGRNNGLQAPPLAS